MYEYKDDIISTAANRFAVADSGQFICSADNTAEEQLNELARLVGGGGASAQPQPETVRVVDTAPALNYDLEGELSKAFASAPASEKPAEFDVSAIETAFAPKVELHGQETVPAPTGEAALDESDIALSDLISKEFDLALEEEMDSPAEEEIAPQTYAEPDNAGFELELSRLMGESNVSTATGAKTPPPQPQQSIAPPNEPEIVEPTIVPVAEEVEVQPVAGSDYMQSQLSDFDVPDIDYSDPAAAYQPATVSLDANPQSQASFDNGQTHLDTISNSVSTLHDEVQQDDHVGAPAVAAPVVNSDIRLDDWNIDAQSRADDDISIPQPEVFHDVGDRPRTGRKAAVSLIAIALLGGTGLVAWNAMKGNDTAVPTILASSESVKVKPKDVGGKVVPNQDQAVFKSVESKDRPAPQQEKLKDNTEKSVAVATKPAKAKAEERLANNEKSVDGTLQIKPRSVRTVVVKPDGTIIARNADDAAKSSSRTPSLADSRATRTIADAKPNKLKLKPTPVKTKPVKLAKKPAATAKPVAKKPEPVKVAKVETTKPVKKPEPVKKTDTVNTTASVSSPYAVQISSQRSVDAAEKSYKNLSRRYASVLNGKGVDIRKAEIKGKGTYYRVRIPAQTKGEANKICRSLKSKGGACIVTR